MSFFYIFSRYNIDHKFDNQIRSLLEINNEFGVLYENITSNSYFIVKKSESVVHNIEGGKLITIGDLFDQSSNNASNVISKRECLTTLGSYSSQNLFGDFILIGVQDKNPKIHFFRNLSSQRYIFYYQNDNTLIVTSSIKLIFDFLKVRPTIHLPYLMAYVKRHFIETPQSPFNNVSEIMRGCTVSFHRNKISSNRLLWNPLEQCTKAINDNVFQENLLFNLKNTLKSNLSNKKKIVLDFSGGFDSTTLLYFLKELSNEQQEIVPINFFEKTVNSSNELHHAKDITKSLNLKLEELDLTTFLPFAQVNYKKENIYPNWPTSSMMYHKKMLYIKDRFLQSQNNDILYLSGHGGDNIFMCPTFPESLVDYYLDNGFNGLNTQFKEFFLLDRDPFFSSFFSFICNYLQYKSYSFRKNYISDDNKNRVEWITKDAYSLDKSIKYHPIEYKDLNGIYPGQKELLQSIIFGLYTIKCNLINNGPICRYPLFSENMINLCLSFPTYNSFRDGYDRYHARSIVSNYFNTDKVWRRDKGETTGVLQKGFAANSKRLIALCMEGVFAKNKLIDRDLLYESLKSLESGLGDNNWPLSSLITAELFCEIWK